MTDVSGFGLGGAARGFSRAVGALRDERQLDQRDRQLDFQERQFAGQQQQQTQAQALERLSATAETLLNAKQQFQGTSDEFATQLAEPLQQFLDQADRLARTAGMPSAASRLRFQLQQLPTASEAQTREAAGAVRGAQATAQALGEAGVPATTGQAAQAAGLLPETPEPPQLIQLQQERDRAVAEGRTSDAAQINDQIKRLGTVVGRTPADVGLTGVGPRQVQDLRASISTSASDLTELEELSRQFSATPEASGLAGLAIERLGGLAQQFTIGREALSAAGIDPAQVTKVRTQARATVARMLTTITKEESRFSDSERRIASETLQALEATASPEQVQAAIQTLAGIMKRTQDADVRKLLQASDLNLAADEDLQKFFTVLRANGFTEDQAVDTLSRLAP